MGCGDGCRVTQIRDQGRQLVGRNGPYRIGLDVHVLEGLHQGSRTHCIELFSRLIRLAPEMEFFLFADVERCDRQAVERFAAPNARFVQMPHTNPFQRLGYQLRNLVKKHDLNLLHTQYISPLSLPCLSAVTIHDILFEDHPEFFTRFFRLRSRLLVKRSATRADLVFTVSEFSKHDLMERYKIDPARIRVIYNAVDRSRFTPAKDDGAVVKSLGLDPGDYFLMVGRLEPRKNHARLIEAYQMTPKPRRKLVIVGQPDFGFEGLQEKVKMYGLEQEVLFLQEVKDDALPALYRHAFCFVYPSLAEGFGMPLLEAMASGVPVISSNTSAMPEIAEGAALLVDPYDVNAIADAMCRMSADHDTATRYRALGLARAATFDWDVEAEKVARAYRDMLGTQAPA